MNAEVTPASTAQPDLFSRVFGAKRQGALDRGDPEHLALIMRRVDAIGGGYVIYEGRLMLMLAGNNYLGLAGDPRLIEASVQATKSWGVTTSGSRLLNGTNELHIELERKLTAFKKTDSMVVFQSGYMANVGLLSALLSPQDVVIMDKLVHASIIDGVTLAGAQMRTFRHQNMESLEKVLRSIDPGIGKLVVADGIYSMDGDFAKLPEIMEISRRYGARVMVDDAHSTGVAGPHGRGTADHFGIAEPDIVTGTLSKALGGVGGFVGASREVIEFIKYNSRSFIYSTSLSPGLTASLVKAIEIMETEPERRENLWACTHHMIAGLKNLGFNVGITESPIIPIILDDEDLMFKLVGGVDSDDIFVSPVMYPACPKKEPRVRLSLTADHTLDDMNRVLDSFARHGKRLGIIA